MSENKSPAPQSRERVSDTPSAALEALARLDDALCNFINAYGDPFEPAAEYEAETGRNLKELSQAYNHAASSGVFPRLSSAALEASHE